jgi:hypothetical protein
MLPAATPAAMHPSDSTVINLFFITFSSFCDCPAETAAEFYIGSPDSAPENLSNRLYTHIYTLHKKIPYFF